MVLLLKSDPSSGISVNEISSAMISTNSSAVIFFPDNVKAS